MSIPPLERLVAGMELDGFRLRLTPSGPTFHGVVQAGGHAIGLRLEYESTWFTEPPRVFVTTPALLSRRVIAHLDEANELCVVNRREYVADRYAVAEHARGIVRKATDLLERSLSKAGTHEIADEFPRHWGGKTVRVRFAPYDGFAKADELKTWVEFEATRKAPRAPERGAAVVQTAKRLSFLNNQHRPNTLGELLTWSASWDTTLPSRLLDGLSALGPADPFGVICAPNGVVAFQVKVSAKGGRLMKAIQKPAAWRTLLRGRFGSALAIDRYQGMRVDTEYVLGTNSATGSAPLAGKNVLLVGCGAIGSFLSFALAQFGAGLSGGALTLIDHETLDPRNLARHRLGADKVGTNKAIACKAAIDVALPDLSIHALPWLAERCRSRILAADLVIDATGEQAVGDLLNEWRLECSTAAASAPALLHVWVVGHGAAAQTYLSSDPAFGCYRCLQPDLSQPPRFPVLRPDADVALVTGCGDAPFAPYGPAAPMGAAALAADHAVDWAQGNAKPLLRTIRFSYGQTYDRKPTNPEKSGTCPACGDR